MVCSGQSKSQHLSWKPPDRCLNLNSLSVVAGCVVLGKLLSAPESQSSHFYNGKKKGSRVLYWLRTYCVPDIAFVLAGILPHKSPRQGLGCSSLFGKCGSQEGGANVRVRTPGPRKSQYKGMLWTTALDSSETSSEGYRVPPSSV